jgi:hypothetical protein
VRDHLKKAEDNSVNDKWGYFKVNTNLQTWENIREELQYL